MLFKLFLFVSFITRIEATATPGAKIDGVIQEHATQGWEYVRLESVETSIAPELGCFGIGTKPGVSTTLRMAVFKK